MFRIARCELVMVAYWVSSIRKTSGYYSRTYGQKEMILCESFQKIPGSFDERLGDLASIENRAILITTSVYIRTNCGTSSMPAVSKADGVLLCPNSFA